MERRLTGLEKRQEKAVEKEVKEYTYYNEKLMQTSYDNGDIYNDERHGAAKLEWEISNEGRPYLAHVKSLAPLWPPLRLLADFMEIGTTPLRWNSMAGEGDAEGLRKREREIEERAVRTKVTRLDYLSTGIEFVEYTTSQGLRQSLENEALENDVEDGRFRLFILEDLSRDMIELLGSHLDIEPGFFREQIFDYAWYNTRDRWVDPPRLQAATKKQRWMQLRFPAARYYKTPDSFKQALAQFERMNVTRKAEDDINNKSKWDEPKAIVGLARTRTSLWTSGKGGAGKAKGSVGVLVVDPTPREGSPLWYGYRNWEETPSMYSSKPSPTGPPRNSIYNDIVFWAKKTDAFGLSSSNPAESMYTPALAILHLVSSEWLEVGEYIRTRLGQIEWEVSFPEHFLMEDSNINDTLKKLHIWRRLVPLYREMLTETLQRVFQVRDPHTMAASSGTGDFATMNADANPMSASTNSSVSTNVGDNTDRSISTMRDDYVRVLGLMEEYQQRIDRLTSVVTAIISIADSQRSREDNKNVARLTWLATFFIPLGFIASIFSMTDDVSSIGQTIKWYLAAALPLSILSLGIALLFTMPSVKKYFAKYKIL